MAVRFDNGLANSCKWTNTLNPGTSSTNGGTELASLDLKGSRPVIFGEIVNPDATHALTVTWQYKCHPDSEWTTLPASYGSHSTTAAANATTAFKINSEGLQWVRALAYFASGGAGSVIFRGTLSDKAPGAALSLTANIGDVGVLNSSEVPIDPATTATDTNTGKATAAPTEDKYGGTTSSSYAVQLKTTVADAVASGAVVLNAAGFNALDIQPVSSASATTATYAVWEFSAATPTAATLKRVTNVPVTAEATASADLAMVGQAGGAGTGFLATWFSVRIQPSSYVMVTLAARSSTDARYCRYALRGSV